MEKTGMINQVGNIHRLGGQDQGQDEVGARVWLPAITCAASISFSITMDEQL